MNNITPIIEAEAKKYINEYIRKGFSEEDSIRMSLDLIIKKKKENQFVVVFWEIEKALIIKLNEIRGKN